MDVIALLKWLELQSALIEQAPWVFITCSTLFLLLGYFASRWRHMGVIDELKAAKDTLLERLHLRTEEADLYKEDASKWREKMADVVNADSADLREKTLIFVDRLRSFAERCKRRDFSIHTNYWSPMTHAESEDERKKLWERFTNATQESSSERQSEYERHFRAESLLLRSELRSRLKDYKPADDVDDHYEWPVNDFGFNGVATDLEMMAKLLK